VAGFHAAVVGTGGDAGLEGNKGDSVLSRSMLMNGTLSPSCFPSRGGYLSNSVSGFSSNSASAAATFQAVTTQSGTVRPTRQLPLFAP
jgi:hypothetical protein